jgi:ribosome-associated toxin RatA of RatAB toxin-antitoxin module
VNRAIEIRIDGDLTAIYKLGAEIEQWPNLLPHYRDVRVRWQEGNRCVARMYASRDGIPVSWMCWQERDPATPRITFRHIGGFTRGMVAVWTFDQHDDDTVTARITHEFRKGWPIQSLDRFVTDTIVGEFFTHNIAGKTLGMVKLLAEAERAAELSASQPVSWSVSHATTGIQGTDSFDAN